MNGEPRFCIDRARVGGPQASRGRIDDARILFRRPPPGPAAARLAPRVRQCRVVARAHRHLAHQRPADAPVPHRRPESSAPVLPARFATCSASSTFVAVSKSSMRRLRRARMVRSPRERERPAGLVVIDDRPPARALHDEERRLGAAHADRLVAIHERLGACRDEVARGILRIGLDDDEVGPVAVAVREAPRDVTVAAGDQHGQAGQRHADQVALRAPRRTRRSDARDTRRAAAAGSDACRWRAALHCLARACPQRPSCCCRRTALPQADPTSAAPSRARYAHQPSEDRRLPDRESVRPATFRRRPARPTRCRADAGKRTVAGGSASRSCARASSSAPLESFRLRYIENAISTESSSAPRRRLRAQQRVLPRPCAGALQGEVDPGDVGIEQLALSCGAVLHDHLLRLRESRGCGSFLSSSSTGLPSSSASSPAAARRMRSIWKNRSWPCAKPVAKARSRRDAARIVGVPSASRSIVAAACERRRSECRRRAAAGSPATSR